MERIKYKKSKRLIRDIDKSFYEYGKNRIFLCGNELNDLFLRDIKSGAFNLPDSLKDYALNEKIFNWFIYVKSNGTVDFFVKTFINAKKTFFIEKTFEDYMAPKHDDIASLFLNFENSDFKINNVATDDTVQLNDRQVIGVLDKIISESEEKEETLLYIEDLDWLAQLYSTKDDTLVKKIKDLEKLRKNLVIISIKNKSLLEDLYFESYDDKELISISKVSTEEIELCLYKILWQKFKKNLKNLSISDLAINFSNTNTNLREVIRIFNKKIEIFGEELKNEDFEFKVKIKEKVFWDDVVLNFYEKEKIKNIIKLFKNSNLKQRGLLLYGPPGNGKTSIAKAIANEEKMYFLAPKLSELKGKYLGHSAPNIRELFEEARDKEPTLIFLDEIDTLFPERDFADSDNYNKDMTNEFLQQLDGVDTGEQKIFVLSATNREYAIDKAVKSRLGFPLLIDYPTENEIKKIYNKELKTVLEDDIFNLLDKENSENILQKSSRMSGRDIVNISSIFKSKINKNIFNQKNDNIKFNLLFKDIIKYCFEDVKKEIIANLKRKGLSCFLQNDLAREEVKLFGIDKAKNIITFFANELKENDNQKKIRKLNKIYRQNGILLYGPPGNGKTELVKLICKENNLIFISIDGKDFVGISQKDYIDNIEYIFNEVSKLSKQCEENEGIILFFDEFDSLANENMSNLVRGVLLEKLSNSRESGLRYEDGKILLIGATNFYEQIDKAIKRAGRFDEHIFLGNPSKEVAIEILKNLLINENLYIQISNLKYFYEKICQNEFSTINYDLNSLQEENFALNKKEFNFIIQNFYKKNDWDNLYKILEQNYICSAATLKNYVNKFKIFLFRNDFFETNMSTLKLDKKIIEEFFLSFF